MKFYRIETERRQDFGEARIVKSRFGSVALGFRHDPPHLSHGSIAVKFGMIAAGYDIRFSWIFLRSALCRAMMRPR